MEKKSLLDVPGVTRSLHPYHSGVSARGAYTCDCVLGECDASANPRSQCRPANLHGSARTVLSAQDQVAQLKSRQTAYDSRTWLHLPRRHGRAAQTPKFGWDVTFIPQSCYVVGGGGSQVRGCARRQALASAGAGGAGGGAGGKRRSQARAAAARG